MPDEKVIKLFLIHYLQLAILSNQHSVCVFQLSSAYWDSDAISCQPSCSPPSRVRVHFTDGGKLSEGRAVQCQSSFYLSSSYIPLFILKNNWVWEKCIHKRIVVRMRTVHSWNEWEILSTHYTSTPFSSNDGLAGGVCITMGMALQIEKLIRLGLSIQSCFSINNQEHCWRKLLTFSTFSTFSHF